MKAFEAPVRQLTRARRTYYSRICDTVLIAKPPTQCRKSTTKPPGGTAARRRPLDAHHTVHAGHSCIDSTPPHTFYVATFAQSLLPPGTSGLSITKLHFAFYPPILLRILRQVWSNPRRVLFFHAHSVVFTLPYSLCFAL